MKMKKNEERKKQLKESKLTNLEENLDQTVESLAEEDKTELGQVLIQGLQEIVEAKEITYNQLAFAIIENSKSGWWQVVSIKFDLETRRTVFGEILYESPLKGEVELRFKIEAALNFNMGE